MDVNRVTNRDRMGVNSGAVPEGPNLLDGHHSWGRLGGRHIADD